MERGDLDKFRSNVIDSFSRIKDDFQTISKRIERIESELSTRQPSQPAASQIDEALIRRIVEETVSAIMADRNIQAQGISQGMPQRKPLQRSPAEEQMLRKINRTRKVILMNRIMMLAKSQNMTLPEVKDIIVHDEKLCSRATFYRYVTKLVSQNKINIVNVNETELLVLVNDEER